MSKQRQNVILLVEDDNDIRAALGFLLSLEGYAVLVAVNGKEAIELLRGTQVDLAILDLMMPVMSGTDFLVHLRSGSTSARRDLPVIVLSAAGDVVTSRIESHEMLMKKPVEVDRLLQVISGAISEAQVQ